MEHTLIIFNKDKEKHIPISNEIYNELRHFLGGAKYAKDVYIFLSEDELVEELDNAVKSKLF